jgi:hypothetical protein
MQGDGKEDLSFSFSSNLEGNSLVGQSSICRQCPQPHSYIVSGTFGAWFLVFQIAVYILRQHVNANLHT